jgi:hypothetical protein
LSLSTLIYLELIDKLTGQCRLRSSEPRRLCWNATQALTYPLLNPPMTENSHLDLIEGELSAPGATGVAKSRLTTVTERGPIGASQKVGERDRLTTTCMSTGNFLHLGQVGPSRAKTQ